ncbi:MAG: hypothetical protein DMF31_10970 [Verrucomicrobia bacterium]|nr:MAG: hypothetical protein DMF31_10970 [Verrucomicrobiota bacterium]
MNIALGNVKARSDNLPFETTEDNIKGTMGKELRTGIVKTRLGKLSVAGRMGEINQGEAS